MKEVETYSAKQNGNILLNANELYCNLSTAIRQEIAEAITQLPFHRYPDETSSELIAAYSKVKGITPDHILAGNGSDEMLGLLIGCFLGKGKKLLTLRPDFSMYDYYASMHESEIVKYPCGEDGSFEIDAFIEYGREQQVDMILFSNPNNPIGHFVSNKQLCRIVEAFPRIPVIIDEAYGEFAKESMLEKLDAYDNLYVTRTLSKAYGLAGARLGFVLSNPSAISALRTNMVPYNISSITQTIGRIVLAHSEEAEPLIEEIILERELFYLKVKRFTQVTFYPSQANYLYGRSERKQELLAKLAEAGIVIRDYAGQDSFRITIGSHEENKMVLSVIRAFEKEVTKG